MNILEFLKERKQILKVSAIALVGAAAVYMVPAHMSSAMLNDGDDGEPIKSSQVETESKDDADQSAQQVTLDNSDIEDEEREDLEEQLAKQKARCEELREQIARLKAQPKERVLDQSTVVSEVDTSSERCVDADHLFDAKSAVTDESQIELITDDTVYINGGEQRLYFCENTDGSKEICFRDKDFDSIQSCKFDVRESLDVKKFLSEAADKLVELGDAFSLKDFVRPYTDLSIKEIYIRGKGRISLDKNADGVWSLILLDDDFDERDFCEFDTSEELDTTKFLSDAVDKLVELGDAFSLKDFVNSQPNLKLVQERYPEMGVYCEDEEQFDVSEQEIISTKSKEIEISLKMLESLPKRGEEGFDKTLELPDESKLSDEDKVTYAEIKKVVGNIETRINEKDPQRQMKIAKEIYTWVAQNIKYLDRGLVDGNVFLVFREKEGVCRNFAELIDLMMRVAKIPSVSVVSLLSEKYDNTGHVFNAIYIESEDSKRSGWTVLDSTLASNIKVYTQNLFRSGETDLRDSILNKINQAYIKLLIDENQDIDESTVLDYGVDIQYSLRDIIEQYEDIEGHIKEINDEIFRKLVKINLDPAYADMKIKIEMFEIVEGPEENAFSQDPNDHFLSKLMVRFVVSKVQEKDEKEAEEILMKYFPACDEKISFQDANREIVKLDLHSIGSFKCCDADNHLIGVSLIDSYPVDYSLGGFEGKAELLLAGKSEEPVENFMIPQEFLDYEVKIVIGRGIKSLILRGDEDITLNREAFLGLDSISTIPDSEYEFKYGCLVDKKDGHIVKVLGQRGKIDDWDYLVFASEDGNSIRAVVVCKDQGLSENVKLPVDFPKIPIKIDKGIRSMIVRDDTEIDISRAVDLENIDATNSTRYDAEDGILYERNPDGSRGEIIRIFRLKGRVGDVSYKLITSDDGKEIEKIEIFGDREPLQIETLPSEITGYKVPIKVGKGIKSLKIKGDEAVELIGTDIEEIDVSESTKYKVEDGVLYEIGATDDQGAQVFHREVDEGKEYKYFEKPGDTILICSNKPSVLLKDFHIPEALLMRYSCIEIGSGIESLYMQEVGAAKTRKIWLLHQQNKSVDKDPIDVKFFKAKDLKKVDVKRCQFYKKHEGKLYIAILFMLLPTDLPDSVEIVD